MKEWVKENLCCHYFTAPWKNVHRSSAQNPISLQLCCLRSRNAAVGILCTLGAGRSGIPFLKGKRDFSILGKVQNCWCPLGNGRFLAGSKAPGNVTDHSYPRNDGLNNEWNSIPTTLYAFMSCTVITLHFHIYQLFSNASCIRSIRWTAPCPLLLLTV